MTQSSIRVVLVNPSHPGNIGAAARAMKLMGLTDLVLVQPKRFPDPEATARATGAADLLEQATVVDSLAEALQGCTQVFATSARDRSLGIPPATARQCAESIAAHPEWQVALVFGRERTGLTNEELSLAHQHVMIPTSKHFSSLNLAQAVMVLTYECFMAGEQGAAFIAPAIQREKGDEPASMQQLAGLYEHLEETLIEIEFLKPKQSATLMQRLRRFFNRAEPSVNELNIFRGILSDVEYQLQKRESNTHV